MPTWDDSSKDDNESLGKLGSKLSPPLEGDGLTRLLGPELVGLKSEQELSLLDLKFPSRLDSEQD